MSIGIIRNLGGGESNPIYQESMTLYRYGNTFYSNITNLETYAMVGGRNANNGWDLMTNNSNLFTVTFNTSSKLLTVKAKVKLHCIYGDCFNWSTATATEGDFDAGATIVSTTQADQIMFVITGYAI